MGDPRRVLTISDSPEPDGPTTISPARCAAIAELLFTATALVQSLATACLSADDPGRAETKCLICEECSFRGELAHAELCPVGRASEAISILMRTPDLPSPIPARKDGPLAPEPVSAVAGMSQRSDFFDPDQFFEPWKIVDGGAGDTEVTDRDGDLVVSFDPSDIDHHARMVACVNFCQGITTDKLVSESPLAGMNRSLDQVIHLRRALPWLPEVQL